MMVKDEPCCLRAAVFLVAESRTPFLLNRSSGDGGSKLMIWMTMVDGRTIGERTDVVGAGRGLAWSG